MDSVVVTYLLALLILLVHVVALLLTRYPTITVFHVSLAVSAVTYAIRPILSASEGGFALYSTNLGWESYNTGLLLQLLFFLFYIIGYLAINRKGRGLEKHRVLVRTRVSLRGLLITASIGFAALAIIHVVSDGGWLPTTRGRTITSAVPYGKVLFPLAVIPLSVLWPQAWVYWKQRRSWRASFPGILVIAALIALVLLYQRAFIVYSAIVVLWIVDSQLKRPLGYTRLALFALLTVLAVMLLRPAANFLVTGSTASLSSFGGDWTQVKHMVLRQPIFDRADIWPVVLEYVEERGFRSGATYLAIFARFATLEFRQRINLLTAVDELNYFYSGEEYWRTNFGFAIAQSHELFINFGWAGMVFGIFPGMLTAWIDNRLQKIKVVTTGEVAFITGAFMTGGFMGELGGVLQWLLAFFLFGYGLKVCDRIRV